MSLRADWAFRGLIHQVTDEAIFEQLDAGKVTAYIGFDPTAPSLHVGNLLQICNLRRLQLAGNRPIALAGGGTGLIGDPSFKAAERPLLTAEALAMNLAGISAQLTRLLDCDASAGASRALLMNNADWLTTVSLTDFLRDVGKHVTINQMVAKDSVKSRLDREDIGLSFTEFSYMLLQGYDFVRLYQDHDCSLQMGGSDQWGNITVGVDLVKKMAGGKAYGLTVPLLLRPDGTKFGKSEGGNENVWLDARLTSPFAFHQFFLTTDDAMVSQLLRALTFLSHDEILELEAATTNRPQERRAQRALADAVVTWVHGAEETAKANRAAAALFSEDIALLDEAVLLEIVADAPSSTLTRASAVAGLDPVELLVTCGLASSKTEARRFFEQGGVYINNLRQEENSPVKVSQALHDRYLVVRRGKRNTHLIVLS
ncbi:MAG: tyrosine--tRNA ligase [Actinomycetota bacterium]|jgi:tyrosyl-tRNA synthetase